MIALLHYRRRVAAVGQLEMKAPVDLVTMPLAIVHAAGTQRRPDRSIVLKAPALNKLVSAELKGSREHNVGAGRAAHYFSHPGFERWDGVDLRAGADPRAANRV